MVRATNSRVTTRDNNWNVLRLSDVEVRLSDTHWIRSRGLGYLFADLVVSGLATNHSDVPVSIDSFPRLVDCYDRTRLGTPSVSSNVVSTQVGEGVWKYSLLSGSSSPFSYLLSGVMLVEDCCGRDEAASPGPWRFKPGVRYDGTHCKFSISVGLTDLVNDAIIRESFDKAFGAGAAQPPFNQEASEYDDVFVGPFGGTYYMAQSAHAYAVHSSANCATLSRSAVESVTLSDWEVLNVYMCPVCSGWWR